jgi:ACR3 family arsenite transporter
MKAKTGLGSTDERRLESPFERYLTLWVALCIAGGILLGRVAPDLARRLDGFAIYVGDAPVISIPIAICLFFMMYPIMVKIDFGEAIKAGKSGKPVALTLFLNWAIKPFTMYAIALFFWARSSGGLSGRRRWTWSKCPLAWTSPWAPFTVLAEWSSTRA